MQESLATEHGSELLADALEQFLDCSAVANEGGSHLEATWRDVTNGCLDVVGDPFDEVGAVLVLNVEHLFVDFLHGHATTEHGCYGEVASVTRITGSHHVLGIEHLLGEFRDGECAVLLRASAGERGESRHEEVETREGDHVHGQFPQVSVELTGESQAGGDAAHCSGDQMVEIAVRGGGKLECAEADIVEGLVVDAVGLVCVFYKLVNGKGGVVGLYNSV